METISWWDDTWPAPLPNVPINDPSQVVKKRNPHRLRQTGRQCPIELKPPAKMQMRRYAGAGAEDPQPGAGSRARAGGVAVNCYA